MVFYVFTHGGFKVGKEDIEGKGGPGRLRSVICIMLILIKQIIFCTDFFWSERVMVCKCIFQVRSELTHV